MKTFKCVFTKEAAQQLGILEKSKSEARAYKAVAKTIGLMSVDLRHPSLNTHEFTELSRLKGYKVFESYAQNNTPGAYRVFWRYGPEQGVITIVAIVPHPK